MSSVPETDNFARISAATIALVAGGSILLQIALNLSDGEGLGTMLWNLARYFTILTNLLTAITFAMIAGGRRASAGWMLALGAAMAGVGLVYHALLSHLLDQQGWEVVADQGVHTVAPILTVLWFIAFVPSDGLRWRDVGLVVIWPVIYCLYALIRGIMTGAYPYPFIDATTLTIAQMALNIAGLTAFFYALGALLLGGIFLRERALSA